MMPRCISITTSAVLGSRTVIGTTNPPRLLGNELALGKPLCSNLVERGGCTTTRSFVGSRYYSVRKVDSIPVVLRCRPNHIMILKAQLRGVKQVFDDIGNLRPGKAFVALHNPHKF